MKVRPLLLVTTLLIVVAVAIFKIDWGFNALRLYMAASQPLEVGESPHHESAGAASFTATALTDQLKMPWSFAFMPGGDILVTERGGTLQHCVLNSMRCNTFRDRCFVSYRACQLKC